MTKNKHSIQKVFLEIDTSSMQMANSIKDNLAVFLQNELVPILEKQFDSIENPDNQVIQIEKLEISISSNWAKADSFISGSEAKNDLKIQIEKQVQKALAELKKPGNPTEKQTQVQTICPEEKTVRTLLYFIENGTLPWWVAKNEEINFIEKISAEEITKDTFRIPFQDLIRKKKNTRKRMINQFSNDEIAFIIAAINNETIQKSLPSNKLVPLLNKKSHTFKTEFWQAIFDLVMDKKSIETVQFYHKNEAEFSSGQISFELFVKELKSVFSFDLDEKELIKISKKVRHSEESKPEIKSESSNSNEPGTTRSIEKKLVENEEDFENENSNSKSCYVQNAGLIILHPFLKQVLKNCGLLNENNSISDKELAAHILHYVATKTENAYEHAMVLEKFLCGIPMQQSIQREIKIDENHKQQVEEMLHSVVQHWSALKNTSTDVLRTEFLQREGKLDWTESNPKLTIERKTQDLLLEKIPWNINIIKIPWMEKLIYTQW